MGTDRFDTLARTLRSRRTVFSGIMGALTIFVGLPGPEAAVAHNPLPACGRLKKPKQRAACRRRAQKHNRTHRCKPLPAAPICAQARRCSGVAVDNCGKLINCSCPVGKSCLPNGTCAQPCTFTAPELCPAGCGVCGASVDGEDHCLIEATICREDPVIACTSTTLCPVGQECSQTTCATTQRRCVWVCPT